MSPQTRRWDARAAASRPRSTCELKGSRWQFEHIAKKDAELLDTLKKAAMQVTEADQEAFRKATAPAYDAFYQRFGQDARDFIEAIRKL